MRRKLRAISASVSGTFIEYYDYTLYGFLATEMNQHFFPEDSGQTSFLKVYGLFYIAFLARPFGAVILSKIGDTYGRKSALNISMASICLSSFAIAIIPSYAAIGIAAPLLLAIARIVQGGAISGEGDGIRIFMMEHFGTKRYCLANSFASFASSSGIFAASYLAGESLKFETLHWQYLFLGGAIISFLVYLLRRNMAESPAFIKASPEIDQERTFKFFKTNKKLIFLIALIVGSNGGIYYYLAIFLNGYLTDVLKVISQESGAKISNMVLIGYASATLLIGYFADYLNKRRMLWFFTFLFLIVYLSFCLLFIFEIFWMPLFFILGACTAGLVIPVMPYVITLIPTTHRYRVISMAHALGAAILIGTAPFIGSSLYMVTENTIIPLLYGVFLLLLYPVALVLLKAYDQKYE